MKIQFKKRKQSDLRKLIKTDLEGNSLTETPMYIKLCEVDSNLIEEGTPITEEILDMIQWKDDSAIEIKVLEGDSLPVALTDRMQLVCKANGELWCIPKVGKEAFVLGGLNAQELIHPGMNFIQNKPLSIFNLKDKMFLFSTRLRMGAIEPREILDSSFESDTYIDINNTGTISARIFGKKILDFTDTKLDLTNSGSTIRIDGAGRIYLEAPTSNGIYFKGNRVDMTGKIVSCDGENIAFHATNGISLSSDQTKIQESVGDQKFNCFTEYPHASYGNQFFRLQFYENYIRIMDVINHVELMRIASNGNLFLNNKEVITRDSTLQLIKQYLDEHLNQEIKKYIPLYDARTKIFEGCQIKYNNTVNLTSDFYQFFYSTSESGETKSIVCRGNEINTDFARVYHDGYYKVYQVEATEDWEESYLEIAKEDVSGHKLGNVYIRAIYKF